MIFIKRGELSVPEIQTFISGWTVQMCGPFYSPGQLHIGQLCTCNKYKDSLFEHTVYVTDFVIRDQSCRRIVLNTI